MTLPNPPSPRPVAAPLGLSLAIVVAIGLVEAALAHIAFATPPDIALGVVQKIFYFHVASAFAMLLFLVLGAGLSAIDLVAPSDRADAGARGALEVGALFGAILLVTGPLWARKSWGTWWTFEPRLTLSLLVELLALAVLMLRGLSSDAQLGRRAGAAMAVMAAPISLLIHLAVKLWGGNHPSVLQGGGVQSAAMRISFWLAVAGVLTLASALLALRYQQLRLDQRHRELELTFAAWQLRRTRPAGESS